MPGPRPSSLSAESRHRDGKAGSHSLSYCDLCDLRRPLASCLLDSLASIWSSFSLRATKLTKGFPVTSVSDNFLSCSITEFSIVSRLCSILIKIFQFSSNSSCPVFSNLKADETLFIQNRNLSQTHFYSSYCLLYGWRRRV